MTTALMLLMKNGMLIVFGSIIGSSYCGKHTLDVGVMHRPFITRHTLNIIKVFMNLLPQFHIHVKGDLLKDFSFLH